MLKYVLDTTRHLFGARMCAVFTGGGGPGGGGYLQTQQLLHVRALHC